jgi:hypothetical protein
VIPPILQRVAGCCGGFHTLYMFDSINIVSKLYGSFFFFMIFGVFLSDFSSVSLEEFFYDSFHGFGCYDESHYLPPILE